tara:strand:- start:300 stop:509 length:210 start_codon:yes stop_codon:yes gene_type:complete
MLIIIEKNIIGFLISSIDNPRLNMAIISLSLSNLIKAIIIPNITINGNITFIKLGIKNIDKFKISKNLT